MADRAVRYRLVAVVCLGICGLALAQETVVGVRRGRDGLVNQRVSYHPELWRTDDDGLPENPVTMVIETDWELGATSWGQWTTFLAWGIESGCATRNVETVGYNSGESGAIYEQAHWYAADPDNDVVKEPVLVSVLIEAGIDTSRPDWQSRPSGWEFRGHKFHVSYLDSVYEKSKLEIIKHELPGASQLVLLPQLVQQEREDAFRFWMRAVLAEAQLRAGSPEQARAALEVLRNDLLSRGEGRVPRGELNLSGDRPPSEQKPITRECLHMRNLAILHLVIDELLSQPDTKPTP